MRNPLTSSVAERGGAALCALALLAQSALPLARADGASEDSPEFAVTCRDAKHRLAECRTRLPDLVPAREGQAPDAFRGRHFVVTLAEGKDPIPFSADPALVQRAATVYAHLEEARRFAASRGEKDGDLAALEARVPYPVVVRLEMTRPYSDVSHFVTNGQETYNNSLTIAASRRTGPGVEPWGEEIWFYRSKDEKRPSAVGQVLAYMNLRAFRNLLLRQMTFTDLQEMGREYAVYQGVNWIGHLASLASSLTITELLLPMFALGSRPLKDTYAIDTAMLPEVVYHEFGHLLFQGRLGLFRPTAIVEGYPNYFAYEVSGMKNLASKAGEFMKGYLPKKAKAKDIYSLDQELSMAAASGSFVYSLLYQLGESFGEERDAILYGALESLDRGSEIRLDFERAILDSVQKHSAQPLTQTLRAHAVFQKRGL